MYKNLICLLALAGSLGAAPVTVNNFSFEDFNPLTIGCGTDCAFNITTIPGWTGSGSSGSFQPGNPSNTDYFDFIPNGAIVAYTNSNAISQVVGNVVANTTYTLLVEVGNRKDRNFPAAGIVKLLVGATEYTAAPVAVAEGGWSTFSVVYSALASDVGQALTIRLSASEAQGNFDNVRLNAEVSPNGNSPVPEPAGLGAVGLGLLAVARRYRRR